MARRAGGDSTVRANGGVSGRGWNRERHVGLAWRTGSGRRGRGRQGRAHIHIAISQVENAVVWGGVGGTVRGGHGFVSRWPGAT